MSAAEGAGESGGFIDARLILEAQGAPKEKVESSLARLVGELEKQDGITIYDKNLKPVEDMGDGLLSALADLGVKFNNFESLISIVLNFGPSALLINEPAKVEITAGQLQNAVGDISMILRALARQNLGLKLQREEMIDKLRELGAFEPAPAEAEPGEGFKPVPGEAPKDVR